MRPSSSAFAATVLAACLGCGPAPVGVSVDTVPSTAGPPAIHRGGTLTLRCAVGRAGGRLSRAYRGAVKVRVEAGDGLSAEPDSWEGVLSAEDYAGVERHVTV